METVLILSFFALILFVALMPFCGKEYTNDELFLPNDWDKADNNNKHPEK